MHPQSFVEVGDDTADNEARHCFDCTVTQVNRNRKKHRATGDGRRPRILSSDAAGPEAPAAGSRLFFGAPRRAAPSSEACAAPPR